VINVLDYAAALSYSPRGESEVSRKSRAYRDALKRADPVFLQKAAAHVSAQVAKGYFPGFFGSDATLVPVPGSAPRRDQSSLWVPERLCQSLVATRLAGSVWAPLRRLTAVPKSAYAARGGRPAVQVHVDSLVVDDYLAPTETLVLVDDFVTKGRTLIACASVLGAALPGVRIKAFALIRTMGLVADISQIVDPVVGEIRYVGDDASRDP
jgi:hypothetical protein